MKNLCNNLGVFIIVCVFEHSNTAAMPMMLFLGPNTITIIKDNNGRFFGGFNELAWNNGYCYRWSNAAWLWRFVLFLAMLLMLC